eukprot:8367046-Ditylum_brightwellii.AAC.1
MANSLNLVYYTALGELESPPHHNEKEVSFIAHSCTGEIACWNLNLLPPLTQKQEGNLQRTQMLLFKKKEDEEGKLGALPSVSLLLCLRLESRDE